jgi:Holliday junction resolvase-like predicted endonuclease
MNDKDLIGKIGENIACGYLVNKGYQIIDTNYRQKFGEIDIIAKSPDKTLVFIEVKTITAVVSPVDKSPASYPLLAGLSYNQSDDFLLPEDEMSHSKIDKFKKISEWYANEHPDISDGGYQLDAITIMLDNSSAEIRHYKNI